MSCTVCAKQCREEDTPAYCEDGACEYCPAQDGCDKGTPGGADPEGRCPICLPELDDMARRALALHGALTGPLGEMIGARLVIERYGATWELLDVAAWVKREKQVIDPEPDPAQELAGMFGGLLGAKRR